MGKFHETQSMGLVEESGIKEVLYKFEARKETTMARG